jgi:hypothetical protein
LLLGDVWQCLETLVFTAKEGHATGTSGWKPGRCWSPYSTQDACDRPLAELVCLQCTGLRISILQKMEARQRRSSEVTIREMFEAIKGN